MKKTLFITFLALVILSVSVVAWTCNDTDAARPTNQTKCSVWGDNGLLNGTTTGWSINGKRPTGCTGTQGKYICNDKCYGTTLVEFYCGTKQATKECDKWNYNRFHIKTTCKEWKEVKNPNDTIILSKKYKNSDQCIPNDVPEFGFVAGGIATVGVIAGALLLRKKE
jgi:hypothetical protein